MLRAVEISYKTPRLQLNGIVGVILHIDFSTKLFIWPPNGVAVNVQFMFPIPNAIAFILSSYVKGLSNFPLVKTET